jgi:hypothetical protein
VLEARLLSLVVPGGWLANQQHAIHLTPHICTFMSLFFCQLEQQYEHVVSQVIHSTSAERSFQRTLEAIRRLSREPYWAALPAESLPK